MVKTKIAGFLRHASLQGKRRRVVRLRDEFLDLRIQRASITSGAQPA
jgi:hypothetical protein